jgi:hypothetical protein
MSEESSSRASLVNEAVTDITHLYTDECRATSRSLCEAVGSDSISRSFLSEKVYKYAKEYNIRGITDADVETCIDMGQVCFHIGETTVPLYRDFSDWTLKNLQAFATPQTQLVYSGRDSLPFYLAAQHHPGLQEYKRIWFRNGRNPLEFLEDKFDLNNGIHPNIAEFQRLVGSKAEIAVVDFGFAGTPDRAFLAYLEYLREIYPENQDIPIVDLKMVMLFYGVRPKLANLSKYFGLNILDKDFFRVLDRVDGENRDKFDVYFNNKLHSQTNGWEKLKYATKDSEGKFVMPRLSNTFSIILQELGAGVVESTRDTLLRKPSRTVEQAPVILPLQIILGREAFLNGIKKGFTVESNISRSPVDALNYLYDLITDPKHIKLFINLLDINMSLDAELESISIEGVQERMDKLAASLRRENLFKSNR